MNFPIQARSTDQKFQTRGFAGPSLLELLQQAGVPIKSSCLGKGICRQCRVKVESGVAAVSSADRKSFSEERIREGWRLSCCIRPKTAISVFFPQAYVFGEIITVTRAPASEIHWVCDLGTTGIEVMACDQNGELIRIAALSKSVVQGADIMTRLEYAQRNGVEPLFQKSAEQLNALVAKVNEAGQKNFGATWNACGDSKKGFLAGNSAVTSFLARLEIAQLAVAPYQPITLESQTVALDHVTWTTLPLLTSFIGGDLFAGLFVLWTQAGGTAEAMSGNPWILTDVGTNSEILGWDGTKLWVSSTPAGPAFEGSNISIGMRAENGAITNPRLQTKPEGAGTSGDWTYSVIGGDTPKGICGSALVQSVYEMVRGGVIKADGEVLREAGLAFTQGLSLSQDDIREFQLAKSAIRSGLDLVIEKMTVKPKTLYLAGAFGQNLPLDESRWLGMLPRMTTRTLGNSSLDGTLLWAQASGEKRKAFQSWLNTVKMPFELSLSDRFQDLFVKNMHLEAGPEADKAANNQERSPA
ncbi:MAG: DUF4445 domain-containing protein [Bdellovibrionales bacterium]|nr:DUF4445 domain-containing protein [Bdellovibrionales bacterium]